MARLLILVEGETEETFVNEILRGYLYEQGFTRVDAKLMGNSRQRSKRGGVKGWSAVKTEVLTHLRTDLNLHVSTMADYYALPGSSSNMNSWPGRALANTLQFSDKAIHIEEELCKSISSELPNHANRFIPYIMMHEFEGLLFSDCETLANSLGCEELSSSFQSIRDQYSSPEEINDSPDTHPSQRIKNLIPIYEKPLFGNMAALDIGLETFRNECPAFARWLRRLEELV